MPRAQLIRSDVHCYHVTGRTEDKVYFPILMPSVWNIFMDELAQIQQKCQLNIHAFVLMHNHFHLLVQTPQANLDQAMQLLMRNTAVRITKAAQLEKPLWGGRYKWSLIDNRGYYYQVYRYILQNPLRAGIVEKVESYPFSSLVSRVPFPLYSRLAIELGGEAAELAWLNERVDRENEVVIQRGLRHAQFDVNKKKMKLFEKLRWPRDAEHP